MDFNWNGFRLRFKDFEFYDFKNFEYWNEFGLGTSLKSALSFGWGEWGLD